jgi:hypothetical protein
VITNLDEVAFALRRSADGILALPPFSRGHDGRVRRETSRATIRGAFTSWQ